MGDCPPESHVRFETLKFCDQLLLWAARMWIAASTTRPTMPSRVGEAFGLAGVSKALASLHELLTMIRVANGHSIGFQPVCCPLVAPAEARFLTILTAARVESCEEYALELLLEWVPPAAARIALSSVHELARDTAMLGHKGSPLAWRFESAQGRTCSSPDPGLLLVH